MIPEMVKSNTVCTVLPRTETSLVMREMTSPLGVSSTNLTASRRILSLMRMRSSQVKSLETTLFMMNMVARLQTPAIR